MNPSLKSRLTGLALVFAASPTLADGWSATPWPSASAGGNQLCFLGYDDAPRFVSVAAISTGQFFMSVVNPVFDNAIDGGEVRFTFPTGQSATTGSHVPAPGQIMVGLDEASFHWLLDQLETPGTLGIAAGGGSVTVTVPDQLDGRIGNLRGPLPEGSPLEKPCLELLAGG